jgi:hypothetical protein
MGLRLNLGCANRPLPGYTNLDMQPLPGVDVVWRVDPFHPSLPFGDDSVEEIEANNFAEHILNTVELVNEMGRVSVDGAHWRILTPGYRDENSWRDPNHMSHWHSSYLEWWTESGFDSRHYTDKFRLDYVLTGDDDHGLDFSVTVHKPGAGTSPAGDISS